jgi:hypothetical protein
MEGDVDALRELVEREPSADVVPPERLDGPVTVLIADQRHVPSMVDAADMRLLSGSETVRRCRSTW